MKPNEYLSLLCYLFFQAMAFILTRLIFIFYNKIDSLSILRIIPMSSFTAINIPAWVDNSVRIYGGILKRKQTNSDQNPSRCANPDCACNLIGHVAFGYSPKYSRLTVYYCSKCIKEVEK